MVALEPVPLFRHLKSWPALAALLLMGGAVWMLLPNMVVTLDDDFWYLRSVIKTLQKGRPWTDDWLTPWAASASVISALLFKLTDSFRFAIHFQLAAAAGLAAMGCALFLKRQGISSVLSLSTPLLLLATPTVLFMFLMFTGVALYMACLWWCLLLADRRQWLWFLLPWGLAVASRQSAVAWLALPGWALLQEAWNHRRWLPWTSISKRLLGIFAAAATIILTLKLGMNPTEGQKLALGGIGSGFFTRNSGIPLVLGLIVFLSGVSIASLLRLPRLLAGGALPHLKIRLVAAPFLMAAGAWAAWWFRKETLNTHDCYSDAFSVTALPVLGAVLGLALALGGTRPRGDATLAALGAVFLVALYGGRFDYYFNDALFLGLAAGFPASPTLPASNTHAPARAQTTGAAGPRWTAAAAMTLVFVGVTVWHLRSAVRLHAQQERTSALTILYEQAFRSGKLAPQDVGMATFGYLGWLFQDYYAAHEGREQPVLGGFSRYAQNWDEGRGTGILATLPKSLHRWRELIPTRNRAALRDTPGVPVLLEIKRPLLGRHPVRYALMRGPSEDRIPGTLTLDRSSYQRPVFPLTDGEWRDLMKQDFPR